MEANSAKQLEITRHTTRRAAIWHFARWLVVPFFVLALIIGGSSIALGVSPWDALVIRKLDSHEVLTVATITITAIAIAFGLIRIVNRMNAAMVGMLDVVLLGLTGLIWFLCLWNYADDIVAGLGVASFIAPFFLSILIYSLRVNNAAWLTGLNRADRKAIDEAGRGF